MHFSGPNTFGWDIDLHFDVGEDSVEDFMKTYFNGNLLSNGDILGESIIMASVIRFAMKRLLR